MRPGKCSLAMLSMLLSNLPPFAKADIFESLTYTPPPGWTVQNTAEGRIYVSQQPNGGGTAILALYASRPGTLSASQAFAAYWRLHIERALPGPAPEPTLGREGDYAIAAGTRQAKNAQGVPMNATLVAFAGKGRTFGAMGVATGEELSRVLLGFFGSLRLAGTPENPTNSMPTPPARGTSGGPEIDYEVPPGYVVSREAQRIVLSPVTPDKETPCTYIISPPRPSRGSLDADAEAALLDVYPGWQRMDAQRRIMKGTSATGWTYFWNRAHVWEGSSSAFSKRGLAMAMALPAGPQRVHIVLGRGTPLCTFDDASFVKLLNGLRPHGWTSDGGKALARDLVGTWRWTSGPTSANAVVQYTFQADGRFTVDSGSTTQLGLTETTSTQVRGGRYSLSGSEVLLVRDNGDRKVYRIRVYEELGLGGWKHFLSLLDERMSPQATVEYYRVD